MLASNCCYYNSCKYALYNVLTQQWTQCKTKQNQIKRCKQKVIVLFVLLFPFVCYIIRETYLRHRNFIRCVHKTWCIIIYIRHAHYNRYIATFIRGTYCTGNLENKKKRKLKSKVYSKRSFSLSVALQILPTYFNKTAIRSYKNIVH